MKQQLFSANRFSYIRPLLYRPIHRKDVLDTNLGVLHSLAADGVVGGDVDVWRSVPAENSATLRNAIA